MGNPRKTNMGARGHVVPAPPCLERRDQAPGAGKGLIIFEKFSVIKSSIESRYAINFLQKFHEIWV